MPTGFGYTSFCEFYVEYWHELGLNCDGSLATGTVMPYSVAKYRNDAEDITDAIEASNSDLSDILVQAIASAAQLVVAAVRDKNMSVNVDMDSITQHTIDDINRRTVMFQASPLKEG